MKKTFVYTLFFSQILFFLLLPIWLKLTNYLHPLVIAVVWFCFSSFALFIACWLRNERIVISKKVFDLIIVLYTFGLFILLFFRPQNQTYGSINLMPFQTIAFYFSRNVEFLIAFYNLGANIGLFLPFGLYYKYMKKNPSILQLTLLTICTISIIEGLQFFTKRGSLDIDDLILNTAGVWVGCYIYPLFRKVLVMKQKRYK